MRRRDRMKARDLYKRIFKKIPNIEGVCARVSADRPLYSPWQDGCSKKRPCCPGYAKGRQALMKEMSL